jgi:hypothetical protein
MSEMKPEDYFKIIHKPDPESVGMLCHDPDYCDPCAWFIEIYPDGNGVDDPTLGFAVHWYGGHGRVVCHWSYTPEEIYTVGLIKLLEEDDPDFEGISYAFKANNWYEFKFIKDNEGRHSLSDWLDDIEEKIDYIASEFALHNWPSAEEWNKIFPRGGTLHPPIW